MTSADPDPNDDTELATIEIDANERGESFGLDPERQTWSRLANAALSVRGLPIVRKPRNGVKGCVIELIGRTMLTIRIDPDRDVVILERQELDSVESHLVCEVPDDRQGWRRIRCAAEYFLGSRK
jgi:hypothetical protein